jgi:anti-sigma factor RsiW
MSAHEQNKVCAEIAELLVFYVCDEVSKEERTRIEHHLAKCRECQAQLFEEKEFHAALSSLPRTDEQVDSILLSQCRSELVEKLDDLQYPQAKEKEPAFGWFRRCMALHPAWSAATLVLLGLAGGVQSMHWLEQRNNGIAADQVVNVRSGPRFSEDQLSKMVVAGVNFAPLANSGSQNVRVQLSAEEPLELTGSLDDSDVRTVLTYVIENGDRFDPGVRLDCLDALKARAGDSQVRAGLLAAARKDPNPAVRLKALEALRDAAGDSAVRDVLLRALQHDANPGVRVEAVNLLVHSLENAPHETMVLTQSSDVVQAGSVTTEDGSIASVLRTLENLQRTDPSRYVRLRSASALREISARSDQ